MQRVVAVAVLVAACMAAAPAARSLPGVPPLGTSSNVAVVGNIPGSWAGLNFKGSYMYATSWATGLSVFDISDPAAPELVGGLPIAHFENEDVDLCGDTLLITNDREARDLGGVLYVIDIAEPSAPALLSTLPMGLTGEGRGPGHIANFVTADCTMAWVDGGDDVEVIDLRDREAPKSLGTFHSVAASGPDPKVEPAFVVTHDTERDDEGTLWQVGGGGVAGYRLTPDPLQPKLVSSSGMEGVNIDFNGKNSPYNDFILHNSKRAGDTLLITEEDYIDSNGDDERSGSCNGQGKFETWSIDDPNEMKPLDTWQTELNGYLAGGDAKDSKAPVTVNCSSHWFDYRDGVAAVGWYEQGVRFLDVRDPSNIRQVGYYLPADGATWAAYWVPGTPDLVYTADPARGIDILRVSRVFDKNAPTVEAPMLDSWFGVPGVSVSQYRPSPLYGWSCVLPT
jgi:hypothetical protein